MDEQALRISWQLSPTAIGEVTNYVSQHDVVKTEHKTKGKIIGSVRSLKEAQIALRTNFSDNFLIGYNKTSLLYRPSGLIYCRI